MSVRAQTGHAPGPKPKSRRQKLLYVSAADIASLFSTEGRYRLVAEDLPADAVLEKVYLDMAAGCFVFIYAHPSFEPVGYANKPPSLEAEYRIMR